MLCNANTVLIGNDVVLVPYRTEHVATYHAWMTSAELRELTASEPLTLEEEYDMQRQWREDEDKLTFIILARDPPADAEAGGASDMDLEQIKSLPMAGDVNLFLKGTQAEDGDEFEAEVEIMIAERRYRRRHLAAHALALFLSYATSCAGGGGSAARGAPLPVPRRSLVARIGETNAPSIRLFERLGFEVVRRVAVFGEVEMRATSAVEGAAWERGVAREVVWGED